MRTIVLVSFAFWCIGCSGCSMFCQSARNVAFECGYHTTKKQECKRNHIVAQETWGIVQSVNPGPYSEDYAIGFEDGFVDYLKDGTRGNIPAVPPSEYWGARYQTPRGRQQIADWFAGFRHGMAVAREVGFRRLTTVPSPYEQDGMVEGKYDRGEAKQPATTPEPLPRPSQESGDAEFLRRRPVAEQATNIQTASFTSETPGEYLQSNKAGSAETAVVAEDRDANSSTQEPGQQSTEPMDYEILDGETFKPVESPILSAPRPVRHGNETFESEQEQSTLPFEAFEAQEPPEIVLWDLFVAGLAARGI